MPTKKSSKKKVVKKAIAKKSAKKAVVRRRSRLNPDLAPAQGSLPLEDTARELNTSTLRPGFLVSLKTSVRGNVSYDKEIIEQEHRVRSGAAKEKWQTERTIEDPEEFKRANQVRMKARAIIGSVCAISAFGWLCPKADKDKLAVAMKEARREVATFNRGANLTSVAVYIWTGEFASNDVEAVRAIKSEVRDLLDTMTKGVRDFDAEAIRKAANQARNLGSMLTPAAQEQIKGVIDKARSTARKIVKAGETAAQEVDAETVTALSQARTAFLDIDPDAAEVALPDAEARAVDLHEGAEAEAEAVPEEADEPAPARSGRAGRGNARRAATPLGAGA